MEKRKDRKSSIEQLPPEFLEKFQEMLGDPRINQLEVTRRINELLVEAGMEDKQVSKSAVNRYKLRMDRVGRRIRESREVADMFISKFGAQPQGKVGNLLNEMVRTMAFESMLDFSEGGEKASPKMLKDLAVAVHRLERAATENVKRDEEIRKQALTDAADMVDEMATQQGLDQSQAQYWREQILGIK
jgi:hypothetical protein